MWNLYLKRRKKGGVAVILKGTSINSALSIFLPLTSLISKSQGLLSLILFVPISVNFLPSEFKYVILKSELSSLHFHKFPQLELN